MQPIPTVSVQELQQRLAQGAPPLLLDVREPDEWQICRIQGAALLPISELPQRLGELDPARDTIVYCHHGVRSLRVVEFLMSRGFSRVASLSGGIDAWSVLAE